jgi:hypothetical protein
MGNWLRIHEGTFYIDFTPVLTSKLEKLFNYFLRVMAYAKN